MMKSTRLKRLIVLLVAVAILGVAVMIARSWRRQAAEAYRSFPSPNGHFEIVVYRFPQMFAMPGQGSDAPGYFQLREVGSGRVLHECSVEMVQLVDQVEWSPSSVDVKLLAKWVLPNEPSDQSHRADGLRLHDSCTAGNRASLIRRSTASPQK